MWVVETLEDVEVMGTCAEVSDDRCRAVPPAPRVPELTAAQLKKNRDREHQRRKRAHASRRSVGTAVPRQRAVEAHSCKRVRITNDD